MLSPRRHIFRRVCPWLFRYPERTGRIAASFKENTLYGFNMLSIKPANDTDEFYEAIERIKHEMDCSPHTP